MAERKDDKDAKDEARHRQLASGREDRNRDGDLRTVVGTPGATPRLSADPNITTTPVTLSGEQAGGTILLDTGHVAYTQEGAVSATPGGPLDPTIIPGQFEGEAPPPGVRMVDRASAPGGETRGAQTGSGGER